MASFVKKSIKPKKIDGSYVFGDFSYGLYNLDTPRVLPEQLASLALTGGRNVWAEHSALVPQHGYMEAGQIDENELVVYVTKEPTSTDTFFIVANHVEEDNTYGVVYVYIAGQGLKKYKTTINSPTRDFIGARRGNDLIFYDGQGTLFGSYYDEATVEVIDTDIPVEDYTTYFELTIPADSLRYYWVNKFISINSTNKFRITEVGEVDEDTQTAIVKAVRISGSGAISGTATIGEKCNQPLDFTFKYEDTTKGTEAITPQLMNIANNRLFIVDVSGKIYYSAVGNVDNFDEAFDAGYFQGFYNDNSKVLSIEDYMSGVLICKENGIYYLELGGASLNSVSSEAEIGLSIRKITNIGQQYPTDHVIVRSKVYAYDSNSGSIVLACQPNYYNNLIVAGDVIVSNDFLNSQDLGIGDSKRYFTYNSEFEVITLYYGERLNRGILLTQQGGLFPRELDITTSAFVEFSQGVVGVTPTGLVFQDFKKGTVIPNITSVADFEAIGLRDNRLIHSTILEVTELNGTRFTLTTQNAGYSFQEIIPTSELAEENELLPNMMYSDKAKKLIYDSFEFKRKWADKTSNVTRIAAPMSGREGIKLTLEFPANTSFCLVALRLPDFSQGE